MHAQEMFLQRGQCALNQVCGYSFDGKNCERQVQHQTAADSEDSDQDPDATADQFTDILSSSDDE